MLNISENQKMRLREKLEDKVFEVMDNLIDLIDIDEFICEEELTEKLSDKLSCEIENLIDDEIDEIIEDLF